MASHFLMYFSCAFLMYFSCAALSSRSFAWRWALVPRLGSIAMSHAATEGQAG